jgi:cytochrome o ubiquinol oxidase subunit IV
MKKISVFTSYVIGLVSSVILTFTGYILASIHQHSHHQAIPHTVLIPIVLLLAFLQLLVQLFFFLHIWKKDSTSRWNLAFFIVTFFGILAIVVGSIWIMYHLNYNMTPQQMNQYIDDQSGF